MLRIGTLVALLVWSGAALADGIWLFRGGGPPLPRELMPWETTEQQLRYEASMTCALSDHCMTFEQVRAECLNKGECI